MRNAFRLTFGVSVSLACLWFATRGTDWGRVGETLGHARPGWTLACGIMGVLSVYVRAQRWRVLLRPLGDVPLYPALSATAIGFGASAVLPFRLGELIRPALLGRRVGVRMSATLSSVVLERLFDVLFVIANLLGLSLLYPIDTRLRGLAVLLAAGAAAVLVTLMIVHRWRGATERLLERVLAVLPARVAGGLRPIASAFLDGLGGLRDARTVLVVLAYSAYLWGVIALTFTFAFLALDIAVPLLPASSATVFMVAAAVFLPQAPGFVGTWQLGCVGALSIFGVGHDAALGYSLLTWVVQMVVNLATAGFFLAREDFSLGQLLRLSREAPAAGAEAK